MPLPPISNQQWDPSFPEFAVPNDRGLRTKDETGGTTWEQAPASSHVYGWKFQSGGFVKKFYGPSAGAPPGTVAVLTVGFKLNGTQVLHTVYEYYFTSEQIGRNYHQKLQTAEHPGHVVQMLIAQRVPYKKTGQPTG